MNKSLINININKDDSNLNDFLSIWDYFGKRPNKITIHTTYSTKLFTELMSSKFVEKNTFTEILADDPVQQPAVPSLEPPTKSEPSKLPKAAVEKEPVGLCTASASASSA